MSFNNQIVYWVIAVLLCVFVLGRPAPARAADPAQPNIVLFLVDDMGWNDWYSPQHNPGGIKLYDTPSMVRLADRGVVFTQAYAASPVCSPTRSAIMTGKNPARTRFTDWVTGSRNKTATMQSPTDRVKNISSSEVTLGEALQGAGYATGFIGKWHLGDTGTTSANPLLNGFDVNIGGAHYGQPPEGYFAKSDGDFGVPNVGSGYASDAYLTDVLTDFAETYIHDNANQPQPFFLMMSHYAVHNPKQAPADMISANNTQKSQLQAQGENLADVNTTYASMVEKMDESLGRLMDRLDDPDGDPNTDDSVTDNTIIIFTSDNGGLFDSEGGATTNAPLREGKGSIYEGGIREPFIVSWAGNNQISQGTRNSQARLSAEDIYPTLLALTESLGDAGHNAQMDGVSFAPALFGQAYDRGAQFWHYPHYSNQDAGSSRVDGGKFTSAVRIGDWKLIWFYDIGRYELYNVVTDIGETHNVFDDNPLIARQLSLALHTYLDDVDALMPELRATGQPVGLPPILPVPEPTTLILLAACGAGLMKRRR